MKQLTVKDLLKICQKAVKEGYGDKTIVVADDNEGNGYHGLFYSFTPIQESDKEYFQGMIYDSQETDLDKIIILG